MVACLAAAVMFWLRSRDAVTRPASHSACYGLPDEGQAGAVPVSCLGGGRVMRLFIGLDVSLATTAACVLDEYADQPPRHDLVDPDGPATEVLALPLPRPSEFLYVC